MGFIPDITCRHCGKKFSAIHSRCPHCGAKKVKDPGTLPPKTAQSTAQQTGASAAAASAKTGRSAGGPASLFHSNTKWQFLFGCVLILLVIVAVIVLISTSVKGAKKPVETPPPPVEVTTPPPTTTPPTPSPTPTVAVNSISISFLGEPKKEFTQRVEWAPVQLKADVYPTEALTYATVEWRSTDESVITVEDGLVTGVGPGVAEVVAECGGVAASCRVVVP